MSHLVGFRARNHPQQRATDEVDDRATPLSLFGALDTRFRFTVDVAAAAHNAKCSRYYTRDDDGLRQSWATESVWCNPPYSDIAPWVEKAWLEHGETRGVVLLLPNNRHEQGWWQRLVEPYRDRAGSPLTTEYLPDRIRFIKAGRTEVGPGRPPFGCMLLIWAAPVRWAIHTQTMLGGAS